MTETTLANLLTRIAAQDRAAFRALYAAASAKLFGTLLRILGNRAEAEDALQEVFTRVWLRAGRYDPEKGQPMTWLIAITRNHAIDRLRARADVTMADGEAEAIVDRKPSVETSLIKQGEARRIVDCMGQLEPDRARAVQGAYLGGLSYQQLADNHAVPINTMRTWLRRSLASLRECMDA